jgi:hypothetical protein
MQLKTNYVLVDYENAPVKSLALLTGEQFRVYVYLGPHNTRLPLELVLAMQEFGDRAKYIVLEKSGINALDFHIAYYLGSLTKADPEGFYHIISKDTGFDPLISHIKSQKIFCARSISIEEMPCFKKTASVPASMKEASIVETISAPIAIAQTGIPPHPLVSDLMKTAVNDLIKRKASKPRTPKTLRSTIHAVCGKETSSTDIDAVFDALEKKGYVKINGLKVTYALPHG